MKMNLIIVLLAATVILLTVGQCRKTHVQPALDQPVSENTSQLQLPTNNLSIARTNMQLLKLQSKAGIVYANQAVVGDGCIGNNITVNYAGSPIKVETSITDTKMDHQTTDTNAISVKTASDLQTSCSTTNTGSTEVAKTNSVAIQCPSSAKPTNSIAISSAGQLPVKPKRSKITGNCGIAPEFGTNQFAEFKAEVPAMGIITYESASTKFEVKSFTLSNSNSCVRLDMQGKTRFPDDPYTTDSMFYCFNNTSTNDEYVTFTCRSLIPNVK